MMLACLPVVLVRIQTAELMLNNINFSYPLKYSYYIEPRGLANIKRKTASIITKLQEHGFEEVKLPFIVSPSLLDPFKNEYNSNNLIKLFPGVSQSKYAYLSPYMLFVQAVPLLKVKNLSYKNFPILLFDMSPSFKGLIKSADDPFTQTEEIFSFQGGIFELKATSQDISAVARQTLTEVLDSLHLRFDLGQEILFYLSPSWIFRDKNGVFLGGYHTLSESMKPIGLRVKNQTNIYQDIKLTSISISQNAILL